MISDIRMHIMTMAPENDDEQCKVLTWYADEN